MKVRSRTPYGPMRSERIQLDPNHVAICQQKKIPWDCLRRVMCSGETTIFPGEVEYELWGFTKPCVVVPRDKLVRIT